MEESFLHGGGLGKKLGEQMSLKKKLFSLSFLFLFVTGARAQSSPHLVTLKWTASTTPNVTQYNVYKIVCPVPVEQGVPKNNGTITTCTGTAPAPALVGSVNGTTLTFGDPGVNAGVSYEYYVTAFCQTTCGQSVGPIESIPSNTVVVTITPLTPGGLMIKNSQECELHRDQQQKLSL